MKMIFIAYSLTILTTVNAFVLPLEALLIYLLYTHTLWRKNAFFGAKNAFFGVQKCVFWRTKITGVIIFFGV